MGVGRGRAIHTWEGLQGVRLEPCMRTGAGWRKDSQQSFSASVHAEEMG